LWQARGAATGDGEGKGVEDTNFVRLDQLQSLPDSMSKLNDLEHFGISSCLMLKEPPKWLEERESRKHLSLGIARC
jgi:hypothetical protein